MLRKLLADLLFREQTVNIFTTGQVTIPQGGQIVGVLVCNVEEEYVTVATRDNRRLVHVALSQIVRIEEV